MVYYILVKVVFCLKRMFLSSGGESFLLAGLTATRQEKRMSPCLEVGENFFLKTGQRWRDECKVESDCEWVGSFPVAENRSLTQPQQWGNFPEDPEGMKQEIGSRNALKHPGHTGQRENLFTNHLELHCLLADLFFLLCFQSYFIFVWLGFFFSKA